MLADRQLAQMGPISDFKNSHSSTADTVTIPDQEMLRLMATASVGDCSYGRDQATNDVEERIAKLTGKEAALFTASANMSNRKPRQPTLQADALTTRFGLATSYFRTIRLNPSNATSTLRAY